MNGGIDGNVGLGVGIPVSCFEISDAIKTIQPSLTVLDVETKLSTDPDYSNAAIPIAISEKANVTEGTISVVIV